MAYLNKHSYFFSYGIEQLIFLSPLQLLYLTTLCTGVIASYFLVSINATFWIFYAFLLSREYHTVLFMVHALVLISIISWIQKRIIDFRMNNELEIAEMLSSKGLKHEEVEENKDKEVK